MMTAWVADVLEQLRAGTPVAAAVILKQSGSTPREAGARMLVLPDGSIRGTVGGGLLEAQVMRAAAGVLAAGQPCRLDLNFNNQDAAGDGMICGGRVDVLVQRIDPGALPFFEQLDAILRHGQPAWLLTVIHVTAQNALTVSLGLLQGGRLVGGSAGMDPDWLAEQTSSAKVGARYVDLPDGGCLFEPLRQPEPVFIFGAGHVSRQLARLAAFAGFRVVVLDDRDEFADARYFPDAERVMAVPGFARVFDFIHVTPDSYLVIVTRGHLDDQVVLEGALRTDAAYIGMIGSRRKRVLIDQQLLEKGFTPADLERVCSPIGLPIGAETPEEIAVSIVAQLIASRAARRL